jgi:predicted ribosomally synthesized peptide with SipW-like signal peptide
VVIISALVIAGVSGTLADFSDIETSPGNTFRVGALDGQYSTAAGGDYDDVTQVAVYQHGSADAWPCYDFSAYFDVHSDGQGSPVTYCYMEIVDIQNLGHSKTEPENAAEVAATPIGKDRYGDPVYATDDGTSTGTPLLGLDWGEDRDTTIRGELMEHVDVTISVSQTSSDGTAGNASNFGTAIVDAVKLDDLELKEIYLGSVENEDDTGTATVWEDRIFIHMSLHLQDVDEDDIFDAADQLFDESNAIEKKWDHWPTNALQKDKLDFDIVFEYLQVLRPYDYPD